MDFLKTKSKVVAKLSRYGSKDSFSKLEYFDSFRNISKLSKAVSKNKNIYKTSQSNCIIHFA